MEGVFLKSALPRIPTRKNFDWRGGGDSANLLTAAVGDPNSAIPESKAFMVNIEKMPDQDLPE